MASKIDAEKLYASLEIGKVPPGKIIGFTPLELIHLYERFYQEFLEVENLFSEEFIPEMSGGYSFPVCVPNNSTESIIYAKMGEFFKYDSRLKLDNSASRRGYMKGDYIIATSVASKSIESCEYVLRRNSQFMTLLEAQIFWLFLQWLAGPNLWIADPNSIIVTSSRDFSGAFLVLDCQNRKIFGQNFSDFEINFGIYDQNGSPNPFRTREIIYKYRS